MNCLVDYAVRQLTITIKTSILPTFIIKSNPVYVINNTDDNVILP